VRGGRGGLGGEADTVVFTADGAEWIWRMVPDRFGKIVEIADFENLPAQHPAKAPASR
jgi:hypothetical protein